MQGRRTLALLPLAPAAALLVAMAGAGAVHASGTTITVTGFGDDPSASCADATHCSSLRAAIEQADGQSGDTIVLPAGTYVLSDTGGDFRSLEITSSMTITGAGASTTTVTGICNSDATWLSRLFTVNPDGSADVTINGLTLTHGLVPDGDNGDGFSDGGAVAVAGGAFVTLSNDVITGNEAIGNGGGVAVDTSTGKLTLTNTIVNDNLAGSSVSPCAPASISAPPLNPESDGGGVYSDSEVAMTTSSIGSNTAGGNGGGLYLSVENGLTDSLSLLYVHDNSAMAAAQAAEIGGGGIYADVTPGGALAVDQSTISNNHAPAASGGGIYVDVFAPEVHASTAVSAPELTVNNTTLNGNTAEFLGGATYMLGPVTASMLNDTVYGNRAAGGGGIAVGEAFGSHLSLESITDDGNGALGSEGGGLLLGEGTATVHNSIIAANTVNPVGDIAAVLHNCTLAGEVAVLTSLGYNLSDDTTCHLTATGDQQPNGVPGLGPLQNNGGPVDGAVGDTSPTLTQALTTGTTAVDTGDPNNFPSTDERGTARPQAAPSPLAVAPGVAAPRVAARTASTARADIGSFELYRVAPPATIPQPTPGPTPTTGVQGIISVPSTGAGPEQGFPSVAVLVGVSLLTAAAGAVVATRRRR